MTLAGASMGAVEKIREVFLGNTAAALPDQVEPGMSGDELLARDFAVVVLIELGDALAWRRHLGAEPCKRGEPPRPALLGTCFR